MEKNFIERSNYMAYTRVNWEDIPSTKTPIDAENLNKMDQGIFSAHEQIDALKANLIVSKVTGEVITTTDSAKAKPKNIRLFGKSTQEGTPSTEAPQPINHLGESGSIVGKLLSGNLGGIVENIVGSGNGILTSTLKSVIVPIQGVETYTISITTADTIFTSTTSDYPSVGVGIVDAYAGSGGIKVNKKTVTTNANAKYLVIGFGRGVDAHANEIMVNRGSEALPFEPYTEQPFTVLTPNGLKGIGDVRDYVDFERGKFVQRIFKTVIDGNTGVWDYVNPLENTNIFGFSIDGIKQDSLVLCDKLINQTVWAGAREGIWIGGDSQVTFRLKDESLGITSGDDSNTKIAKLKAFLTNNPIEVLYYTDASIETPLTEEELDQYNALVMNYPNTTIVNDAGAYMEVEYVCDTKEHIKQNYVAKSELEDIKSQMAEIQLALVNS
jgi:hypothetical protein